MLALFRCVPSALGLAFDFGWFWPAIGEADQRRAELERAKASADSVHRGFANFTRVFAHLQPHEQRELVRLVIKRAVLRDEELVLEFYGGLRNRCDGQEKSEPEGRVR